jgi:hypothetical protein
MMAMRSAVLPPSVPLRDIWLVFVLPLGGVSLGAFTHQRRLFFSKQITLDL